MIKVSQFEDGKNQFQIETDEGTYFQSYNSVIVFVPRDREKDIILDSLYWNYSKTTSKYRDKFLNTTTKEIEAGIKSGKYVLGKLN